MPNEPFAGVPDPNEDPLSFGGQPDEFEQASLAAMLEQVNALASTNYEFLPLFVQSGLLSVIQQRFMMDDDFLYFPDEPEKSRILITKAWNRSTIDTRDKRPIVSVQFAHAQPEVHATRDGVHHTGINEVRNDRRAIRDTLTFKIDVLDHNDARAMVIAQRVRGALMASRLNMQQFFKIQYVGYPDLMGPSAIEEYPDLYQCTSTMQLLTIPIFTVTEDPLIIRNILFLIRANAGQTLQQFQVSGS